jgi:hypothetical protein
MDSVTGAAMATVVVLAYVLLVQCLTAACVLLCEFIVLRVRALWGVVGIERSPQVPDPAHRVPEPQGKGEPYRIGGSILRLK